MQRIRLTPSSGILAAAVVALCAANGAQAAVAAHFEPATGTLLVVGDAADDEIVVHADSAGRIWINGGSVVPAGGSPTTKDTAHIEIDAGAGHDLVVIDSTGGAAPPAASVHGGAGNDVLIGGAGHDLLIGGDGADVLRGGAGNDVLIGGRGNDVVLGQDGDDLLIVNDGDGSDFLEGGEGFDFVQVNGSSSAGDDFSIDPDGDRVRLERGNPGLFTLDIGTVETLDVNGQGGSDVIIGSTGLVGLIGLDLDGGEGNDLLIGGDGVDVLRGGSGNDVLLGDRGDVILDEDPEENALLLTSPTLR